MTHKLLPAIGLTVVAVAVATTFASSANASGHHITMSHHSKALHVVPLKKGNCYSSLMNDNGVAIVSQNFESSFDIYDSAGADNFSTTKTCNTTGVYAVGQYFNGSGPANSETVTFYKDSGGSPGAVIDTQTVTGSDSGGTFTIPLDTVALPPGPKWVSVVANMDFSSGGEWGWETTNNQKQGSNAMWENPADGFGTGCTTYTDLLTCIAASEGPDFMVTVLKG